MVTRFARGSRVPPGQIARRVVVQLQDRHHDVVKHQKAEVQRQHNETAVLEVAQLKRNAASIKEDTSHVEDFVPNIKYQYMYSW